MNRLLLLSAAWLIAGGVALNAATSAGESARDSINRNQAARVTAICEAAGLNPTECNL